MNLSLHNHSIVKDRNKNIQRDNKKYAKHVLLKYKTNIILYFCAKCIRQNDRSYRKSIISVNHPVQLLQNKNVFHTLCRLVRVRSNKCIYLTIYLLKEPS